MEARIARLEALAERNAQRLAALEQDVAIIRSNHATREDLRKELGALTWKLVSFVCGFGTVLVSATWFIATRAA